MTRKAMATKNTFVFKSAYQALQDQFRPAPRCSQNRTSVRAPKLQFVTALNEGISKKNVLNHYLLAVYKYLTPIFVSRFAAFG
jgi:methylphosphotriester-DNA--protein-cysteine methyltransferase